MRRMDSIYKRSEPGGIEGDMIELLIIIIIIIIIVYNARLVSTKAGETADVRINFR